jgi:hypothetical protein
VEIRNAQPIVTECVGCRRQANVLVEGWTPDGPMEEHPWTCPRCGARTRSSSQVSRWGSRSTRCGFSQGQQIDPLPQEDGEPLTTKRVLIFLFALFVVAAVVDIEVPEPFGVMAPWHRALDDSLAIPVIALFSLGPATLCGFVLWRFFFRNEALTLGRLAMLFAIGSAMSCSWPHGPSPVIVEIVGDNVFGRESGFTIPTDTVVPMLVTGGFVAALFAWLSYQRRRSSISER